MKRDNLDFIDIKILNKLQENGRTTNVELSEFVELSAPPCLRRVKVKPIILMMTNVKKSFKR